MNEQSCREMELRAFQGLSQDVNFVNSSGNTINGLGLMTSFSSIGVCGVNAHTGLMKNILRGEWGFKGLISTDMVVEGRFFNPQDSVINNVTFMATSNAANLLKNFWPEYNNKENVRKDPYLCEALYENMHYYMYSLANSSALNGIDPNTDIKEAEGSLSPWEIGLISGSCISGISAIVALGFYLYLNNGQKKENKEVTNND
jgi:beta-glucosidase